MNIDFQMLGKRLADAGLTGKPVDQYSKTDIEALVAACVEALRPEQQTVSVTQPYINAKGELVVPFNSDPKYHWWRQGSQGLFETLRELKAPDEVVRRYVKIESG